MTLRHFSPYEKNQLLKYKLDPHALATTSPDTPVEYLTGFAPFLNRDFKLNPHTLIPRLETEELITLALAHCHTLLQTTSNHPLTVADIGCGCGNIGLTLALELNIPPSSQFYLSDLSPDALQATQTNLNRLVPLSLHSHFHLFTSDLLTHYPSMHFDLLTANLPYIPSSRIATLDASVRNHEPHLALDGGPHGLTLIHRFLHQALSYIRPTGLIILEIDYTHTLSDFQDFQALYNLSFKHDSFFNQRFLLARPSQKRST